MDDQSRRDFLKDALKFTAVVTSGIAVSSLKIKINPDEGIKIGQGNRVSVGMSEASASCGSGMNCSGGGGQCGSGMNCGGEEKWRIWQLWLWYEL